MRAVVHHGLRQIEDLTLEYAGQTNVFETNFKVPKVNKDYEVLGITVIASQPDTANFGVHQRTFKLTP